jgi:hypothetical protein
MTDLKNGITDLMWAASKGDLPGVLEALSDGHDVNEADVFGHTALTYAVMAGHTHTVQALLLMGAKADAENLGGMSPRMIAASRKDGCIERLLTGIPVEEKQILPRQQEEGGSLEVRPESDPATFGEWHHPT